MRVSTVLTLLVGAASAVVLAQEPSQSSRSRDPQQGGVRAQDSQTGQGSSSTTATTTTDSASVVTGHVVRYEPGRVIVVRDATNQERTFNLGPGVTLPVDIHVGSYVELATESNGVNVTRVQSGTENPNMSGSTSGGNTWGTTGAAGTTTGTGTSGTIALPNAGTSGTAGSSTTPSQMNQDDSSSPQRGTTGTTGTTPGTLPSTGSTGTSGNMTGTTTTTTTNTWVSGTVTAFTPGQSVTIAMPGGTTVEYRIDSSSDIPTDLVVGKVVKIQTDAGGEGSQRVARHITYSTKTTTHHKKTTTGTSAPR